LVSDRRPLVFRVAVGSSVSIIARERSPHSNPPVSDLATIPKKQDTPFFDIEAVFLNIAKWVQGGWIKIGDRYRRFFAACALDEGGWYMRRKDAGLLLSRQRRMLCDVTAGTPPPNIPSRSIDATAQRGASEVATGSRFAWADLGCGQSFQQVFHPSQATNIPNESEQFVAAVKAAN
jgi:hypothetical protein